ncbi:hypothetical protein BD289DRAFT_456903 [Coniella lustricola]|uniref:BZIP domain-containing protein n=1 Tax=Coniella lustricola TaxID=2025994 RepID=A0A2T2ZU32_9PEZI|nr:hypothetical protein BD289DRAFT_456903 [Coniella lustricola]
MKLGGGTITSPLAVLNAEQYDDIYLTAKMTKTGKTPRLQRDGAPRKRARTSAANATVQDLDEAEEKTKRTRGRPRLDTTDQTAADRRRTQIRLAQRAYRSRKESAIQTLEKKVQDLRDTNEEMTKTFMKLHDHAVNYGILTMAPDFARELQLSTKVFLSLARRSSEERENDGSDRDSADANASSPPQHQNEKAESSSPELVEVHTPAPVDHSSVWGYTFPEELDVDRATSMAGLALPSDQVAATQTSAGYGYEVITNTALADNVGFPLDMSTDDSLANFLSANNNSTDGSSPTNSQPLARSTNTSQTPLSPLFSSLPLPASYTYNEVSFGRRLQRNSLQRGYQLITMPNPPKELFARSFGFCLLFESIDQIRVRIERGLAKDRTESLNNWSAPFWTLGGTGQNSFTDATPSDPGKLLLSGNQGTRDVGKHALGTSFGFGPFGAGVSDARDNHLDSKMRITLPGFEGDFYDPDEVETYLRSRGVTIRPGQNFVTAEVDTQWLEEGRRSDPSVQSSPAEWFSPSPDSGSGATSDVAIMTPEDMVWDVTGGGGDNVRPALFDGADGLLSFASPAVSSKRIVTIDVEQLVQELAARGKCLGRAPGFRRQDIIRAFWIASNSGSN